MPSSLAHHEASPRTFTWAIEEMKKGHVVRRAGWNGKGRLLKPQLPDDNKLKQSYRCFDRVLLRADLLAKDWEYAQSPS